MSSFNPITSFSESDIGDVDKLNSIIDNQNILHALTPTFLYRRGSKFIDFDEGQAAVFKPVIYAGRVTGKGEGRRYIRGRVPFPAGTFAASCGPVILVTPSPHAIHRKVFMTIRNYNEVSRYPGPGGFSFRAFQEGNQVMNNDIDVHFVAFGYQEA